jgi:hypothetical protein
LKQAREKYQQNWILEQAKPGHFLPDHRLTDVPDFASAASAVSPLSARGGFFCLAKMHHSYFSVQPATSFQE